jgi:hypothetical protein
MESIKPNLLEETLRPQVESIFNELIKIPEISEALNLLESLPENLRYHDKNHTPDVIRETVLFAIADGLNIKDIKLQALAAAWHDTGYLERYENNEPIAVEMFQKSKGFQNLSKEEQEEITSEIMDTQMVMKDGKPFLLKQRSKFGYLLDGDVSNFGRKDFFEKRMLVAEELNIDLPNPETKKKFYAFAIELLKNHEWKTQSARRLRQAQKEINLRELEEEYKRL